MRAAICLIVLALMGMASGAIIATGDAPDDDLTTRPATTRPTAMLIVQGGDADTIFRGWPIRITCQSLVKNNRTVATAPVPQLTIEGPSPVTVKTVTDGRSAWFIPPDQSK